MIDNIKKKKLKFNTKSTFFYFFYGYYCKDIY